MSDQSESKWISNKICKIIHKIDLGWDLEKALKVYTDAWGMFGNLDEVTETLIHKSLKLAMLANKFTHGKHDKKTLGFVKACVAYAHITIPSLNSSKNQVQLYLHTA